MMCPLADPLPWSTEASPNQLCTGLSYDRAAPQDFTVKKPPFGGTCPYQCGIRRRPRGSCAHEVACARPMTEGRQRGKASVATRGLGGRRTARHHSRSTAGRGGRSVRAARPARRSRRRLERRHGRRPRARTRRLAARRPGAGRLAARPGHAGRAAVANRRRGRRRRPRFGHPVGLRGRPRGQVAAPVRLRLHRRPALLGREPGAAAAHQARAVAGPGRGGPRPGGEPGAPGLVRRPGRPRPRAAQHALGQSSSGRRPAPNAPTHAAGSAFPRTPTWCWPSGR